MIFSARRKEAYGLSNLSKPSFSSNFEEKWVRFAEQKNSSIKYSDASWKDIYRLDL